MRDLKHLIFMEDLLQEANNDLVKQAKAEGRRALGYTCNFMPEVLLDLAGCFSVRLRAPRSGSPDMATYYMSARTCHFGRSLMERALEGGFNFLDAQMATETCTVTCRFQEHLMQKHLDSVKDMDIIQNPDFFCEFTDVPFKKTENSYLHYRQQLQAHVLDPLAQNFGIDTSDEALLKAIEQHNEVCRLITEIGSYRKLDVPTITGYEFHVIQLASLTCPKDLILPYLRETADPPARRQARLSLQAGALRRRERRPQLHQAHRKLRRPGGGGPLLLRQPARPGGDRGPARSGPAGRHRPALSQLQHVPPVHGPGRDARPQEVSGGPGEGVQGRRHHRGQQQVLRILEL